jgi:hypothetical protein
MKLVVERYAIRGRNAVLFSVLNIPVFSINSLAELQTLEV